MKPFEIKSKSCLLIFDWHQDVNWVKSILEKEKGNYDYIIWGGDEFDSFKSYPEVETAKNSAKFVVEIIEGKYGPSSLILGNHTCSYYEAHKYSSKFQSPRHLYHTCSGFTKSKSVEISKVLKLQHWQQFHLFYVCNGFFISHAGLAQKFWNYYISKEENYDRLWEKCEESLKLINVCSHEILEPGLARGGKQIVGGLTWLDESEFVDFEECDPQIMGHSELYNCARKHNRSYILDGGQTIYGILRDDGKLEIKSTKDYYTLADYSNLKRFGKVTSEIIKS